MKKILIVLLFGLLIIGVGVDSVVAKNVNVSYTSSTVSANIGDTIMFIPENFIDQDDYRMRRYEEHAWENCVGHVAQWQKLRMVQIPIDNYGMFSRGSIPLPWNCTVIGVGDYSMITDIPDGPCHDHEYKTEIYVS
jgi:hypothetical protein